MKKTVGKMARIWVVLMLLCVKISAQEKISKPETIKWDFKVLAETKAKIQANDPTIKEAYKHLLGVADKLLAFKPISVMEKTEVPPSGNKHDYMSIAPYWWPDPSKPGGVPYIRKDGEVNPEVKSCPDKEHLPKLCENVNLLSLAYYFSGDEKYAAHATELVKVWFLDAETKMNPNLNFGQAIKGINGGRGAGLIETRHLIYLIDGLQVLKGSKAWTVENETATKKWLSEFLNWMQTSEVGKEEMSGANNHGVWFDAQSLSISYYIDSIKLANRILKRSAKRLDTQMEPTGFFTAEMKRTTSLHYSAFILNAFTIVAMFSEKSKTNLWELQTPSGKSYKKAFDALYPYIAKQKEWTGQQIKAYNFEDGFPIFLRGKSKLGCTTCEETLKSLSGDGYDKMLLKLL